MTRRSIRQRVAVLILVAAAATAPAVHAQGAAMAERDRILDADRAFAKSVAERDQARFLTFIADASTFNGGTAAELHGRDAIAKDWSDFFDPKGPTLTWEPTKADVIGGGDLGYSTGRSVFRVKAADGKATEHRAEYLTVWRKQRDGSWKVVFDTGSALPAAH